MQVILNDDGTRLLLQSLLHLVLARKALVKLLGRLHMVPELLCRNSVCLLTDDTQPGVASVGVEPLLVLRLLWDRRDTHRDNALILLRQKIVLLQLVGLLGLVGLELNVLDDVLIFLDGAAQVHRLVLGLTVLPHCSDRLGRRVLVADEEGEEACLVRWLPVELRRELGGKLVRRGHLVGELTRVLVWRYELGAEQLLLLFHLQLFAL